MHRRHQSTNDSNPEDGAEDSGLSDWNPNLCYIYVDLAHVGEYDAALLGQLLNRPSEALPVMEMAAADALRTLLYATQRSSTTNSSSAPTEMDDDGLGGEEGIDGAPSGGGAANNNLTPQQLFGGNSIQIMLRGNLTPHHSVQFNHII